MREVRAAKAHCPHGYVQGHGADEPALRYQFEAAPDRTWSQVNGVDRFAIAETINDQHGHTGRGDSVYQQRGRLLVALYTVDPNTTTHVLTRSLQAFTTVLALRIAALPATTIRAPALRG